MGGKWPYSCFQDLFKATHSPPVYFLLWLFFRRIVKIQEEQPYKIVEHEGWDACGVMVIVEGNGYSDTGSNHGQDWLHFT